MSTQLSRRRVAASGIVVISSYLAGCLDDLIDGGFSDEFGDGSFTDREHSILERYDDGLTARSDGITSRDEGILSFNADEYEDAIDSYEKAIDAFEEAETAFEDAKTEAVDIGASLVESRIDAAIEETSIQRSATRAGYDAAVAASEGQSTDSINDLIETYFDTIENAEIYDIDDTESLSQLLSDS